MFWGGDLWTNGGAVPSSGIVFFWEPGPIVQIPPPAWEVGGPEKASQKGELFESSVIQKRPFNARTWGAEENVGGIAVNYNPPHPKKSSEAFEGEEKHKLLLLAFGCFPAD